MLIAMRNAMMAGKRLPYDAEVEYLESTGTQWIDSGVPYDHTVEIEIDLAKTTNTGSGYVAGILWASGASSTIRRWALHWDTNLRRFAPHYYTTTNVSYSASLVNGVRHTIRADANTFTFDGVVTNVTSSTFDPTVDVSLYIFARHTYASQLDPNPVSGITAWRLFSFKIWKSEVLVRDFVPIRFTNEQNQSEGAMYDRANPTVGMNPDGSARTDGLYRNRGTGAFLYGADI